MKKLLLFLLLLPSLVFAQLEIPYSVKVLTDQPLDWKLGPWANVAAAKAAIPLALRKDGLTVKIIGGGEYWWLAADLSNSGLIPKISGTALVQGANILTQNFSLAGAFSTTIGDFSNRGTSLTSYNSGEIRVFSNTTTAFSGTFFGWAQSGGGVGGGAQNTLWADQNHIEIGYNGTSQKYMPVVSDANGIMLRYADSGAPIDYNVRFGATGGMKYSADVSAAYTSRSLIDKGFSDAGTQTLTNKSMSGSSNTFTNIPLSTAVTGLLPVTNIAPGTDTYVLTTTAGVTGWAAPSGGGGVSFPLSSSQLVINNPAATFAYTFTAAAIAANRTITLPLLAGNDVMVTAAFAQTLTNKTLGSGTVATTATTGTSNTDPASNAFVQQEIIANTVALPLSLANGGLNASLTASNGGIFYSTATAGAILSGTATANKLLVSGASGAPSWSTPTFPNASATTRKIIVSDGTNWTASTETYAVPGTSGNVLTSNGTNWTSAAPAGGTVASFAEALAGTDDAKFISSLKNAYVNQRVYNVKAYGAVGDGVTDDTAAIQAALTACIAGGGGIVYFPLGIYIVGGALAGTATTNSQLLIPSVAWNSANIPGIIIRGEGQPIGWTDQLTTGAPARTGGVILKSTIIGSGTRPRVLGCATTLSIGYDNFNPVPVTVENITIQVRSKTTGTAVTPSMTAFGFMHSTGVSLTNCTAQIEGALFDSVLPTNTAAVGFEMPTHNNGQHFASGISGCTAMGMYSGFELQEHTWINNSTAFVCRSGFLLAASGTLATTSIPISIGTIQAFQCKYGIEWGGDNMVIVSGVIKTERVANALWNNSVADFYAPSSIISPSVIPYFNGNNALIASGTFTGVKFVEQKIPTTYRNWKTIFSLETFYQLDRSTFVGTDAEQGIAVMPIGTTGGGAANKSVYYAFNTDYSLDATNWEALEIEAKGATGYAINARKAGTGSQRDILLRQANVTQFTVGTNGTNTSNGSLILRAGTATALQYPLAFQSGTSLTTPVAGVMEMTTDDLFFTITTGTARKRLLMADATGGLTSGTIPIATTNGRLTDSGISFASSTYTVGAGTKVLFAGSGSGLSSWGAPHGTTPSSPINGDFWTTTAGPFMQINGTTWTLSSDNVASTISAVKTFTAKPIVPTPTGGTEATNKNYVDNAITAAATDGTYTPTLTNTTNVAASTAYVTGYYRVGNSITVYGKIDIDATLAASTATEMGISLPIASDLAAEEDLGGSAVSDAVASLTARIKADFANNRASVVFKALSLTNDSYGFEFSYQVK